MSFTLNWGIDLKKIISFLIAIMAFWAVGILAQSPDSFIVSNVTAPPCDTAVVSVHLRNTQFSVGGFKMQLILSDSISASFHHIERGPELEEFDHFNVEISDGFCRIVGIADLTGNGSPPLNIGYHELAKLFIIIDFNAPWGVTDSIMFYDDSLPPDYDNAISDSTGYLLEIPTLVNGSILFGDPTGTDEASIEMPSRLELFQNYPNPFNAETRIEFTVPFETENVSLAIIDLMGRQVERFFWNNLDAGNHSVIWNGRDDKGDPLASGIYFYRLTAQSFMAEARRMTLLK